MRCCGLSRWTTSRCGDGVAGSARRAFLRNVVTQRADVVVHGDEVLVRLEPLSAPRFTAALSALCHELNTATPQFPESSYRLRYEVAEPREAA